MAPRMVKEIPENILRPGSQILVSASGETYIRNFNELIEKLAKKQGRSGILVSTQWSANALTRKISLSELPRNGLKIIDTISLSLGSRITPSEDFIFLTTPVSLESILMEIERIVRSKKGGYSFLVIDSLTHLNRYYTRGQLNEFFHFLLNRMLEEEFLVVMFDQGGEGSRTPEELMVMLDHKLIITDGGEGK